MMLEKTYMFNPFNLQKVTDEAISEQINALAVQIIDEADTPWDVAHNVEVGANCLYLYGEMIARLTHRFQAKKLSNDKGEALEMHRLRTEWSKTKTEKAPAISYFEATAKEKYELSREEEFRFNEYLIRFKYSYSSMEERVNAWKKRLETFKYDIGGQG